ncbi:hypothetical protein [Streptomyces salinarius]|uniref:hypothetical protein n=1 Tax=Streptomyces salinarius TaxID=2762598 RepID=UPI0013DB7B9B|nr:hypothetical protein [Streptomyces salinarius]
MAESTARAGRWATVASSVISGTVWGPRTIGRVVWVGQEATAHSRGPMAHSAVARSRQTATSTTGKSYFAHRYAT